MAAEAQNITTNIDYVTVLHLAIYKEVLWVLFGL